MTIDLDDVEAITPIDPGDMLGAITAMPQHVRTGFAAGNEAPGMPQADGVTSIVFAGMGGSAIAGDVLRTLARGRLTVPVDVNRGPVLPGLLRSPHARDLFVVLGEHGRDAGRVRRCARARMPDRGDHLRRRTRDPGLRRRAGHRLRARRLRAAGGLRPDRVRHARRGRRGGIAAAVRARSGASGRRTRALDGRARSGRAARRQPREGTGLEPAATASRSSGGPTDGRPRPRRGGRASSTRTRRSWRGHRRCPNSITTRSKGGPPGKGRARS